MNIEKTHLLDYNGDFIPKSRLDAPLPDIFDDNVTNYILCAHYSDYSKKLYLGMELGVVKVLNLEKKTSTTMILTKLDSYACQYANCILTYQNYLFVMRSNGFGLEYHTEFSIERWNLEDNTCESMYCGRCISMILVDDYIYLTGRSGNKWLLKMDPKAFTIVKETHTKNDVLTNIFLTKDQQYLFCGSFRGNVVKYDIKNFNLVDEIVIQSSVWTIAEVSTDQYLFGTDTGTLQFFDHGILRWKLYLGNGRVNDIYTRKHLAYCVSEYGALTCVDWKRSEILWNHSFGGVSTRVHASVVIGGDLYVFAMMEMFSIYLDQIQIRESFQLDSENWTEWERDQPGCIISVFKLLANDSLGEIIYKQISNDVVYSWM